MEASKSILSIKDCEVILQNCLERNNLKVASYAVKSLSDKIEGFLGEHFFVTIEYEDKEGIKESQRCFMKILNGSSQLTFEISKCLNAYNKEEFFYNYLLNEFHKYNIDTSFAPKGYFCKPYLLVLEDMTLKSFKSFPDRTRFLDVEHCKAGLRALAKLHASGLLYELAKETEQKSSFSLVEKFPEMFQEVLFKKDNNLVRQWFEKSIEAIFALIPVISQRYNVDQVEFTKLLERTLHDSESHIESLSKFKGTILHGDLWFNNFLFKYEGDKVNASVLIDYQLLKYGPPSLDVLHFLYTNTRKNIRDVHAESLIEFYYTELNAMFPKHDLESYLPKEEYIQLCNDLQLIMKIQCICDRSITLLVDDVDEIAENDDILMKNLFYRRSERIINSFNTNLIFGEVLGEDMLELYHMLIKSS